ncbi:peptide ABC transporter ATP-binding protein [Aestuariivirga litoralis]|uniref:Peptide ABC transporter ATP-binding protein n=1 Tax=Aestuariivirga litoralis TaxID=2650924 RepID=A0A2W2BP62_9HYPH|nr:ABC transporter ATP-binding protein [Aestuariivirga litoralis]PZF75206.1 peptide ABC transporter ATP-binding protein [Aestuariivirga litoralis]
MSEPLLKVDDLSIAYASEEGALQALRHATLEARAGEAIGIVGESGCGKSTLASALITLLARNARVTSGGVRFGGKDILAVSDEEQRRIRGRHIAMIFQDPMTSFNPVLTIGEQLVDFQDQREGLSKSDKRRAAAAMLKRVGIPDPERCLGRYVHELSGGMRQRAAIAAALLMAPQVLVADEPTTALDVTMEAQIIHLLRALRQDYNGAIVIITHHLGLVGELCDRVYVMYAGEVVEEGSTDDVYHSPRHPYTQALIACDPANIHDQTPVLPTIPGRLPDLVNPPQGCSFAARCARATDHCRSVAPPHVEVGSRHFARCHEALP